MATEGFIYILKAGDYYKIGRTTNLDKRIETLAIQLPFKATVFYTRRAIEHEFAERFLHLHFSKYRSNGEWFQMLPEVAATIPESLELHQHMAALDLAGVFDEEAMDA